MVVLLFILSSIFPIVSSYDNNNFNIGNTVFVEDKGLVIVDNGSLSGFIKGSFGKPIEGAVVQIKCGNFLFVNTSNSSGYYYIGNIPIVDCYWNVSVSKTGYITITVDMSIDENTTYDFILKYLGKILYVGGNGSKDYSTILNDFIKSGDDCDCNNKDDSFICYILRLIYWAILYPFATISAIIGLIPKIGEIFEELLYNIFVIIITPLGLIYQFFDCPPMGFPK